jgi:AcrR family transcriptional regulator
MTRTVAAGDTRDRILDAAEALLRRQGLAKTTVVDVARALDMSHANVYRHFASKAALQDALVERWLLELMAPLTEIAERSDPPAERLVAWVLAFVEAKRRRVLTDPELFDAYHAAASESRDVVAKHMGQGRAQLVGIIRDGVTAGTFRVRDPEAAAAAVMDAMVRFYHPHHIRGGADPGLDGARRVLELLVAGLQAGAL